MAFTVLFPLRALKLYTIHLSFDIFASIIAVGNPTLPPIGNVPFRSRFALEIIFPEKLFEETWRRELLRSKEEGEVRSPRARTSHLSLHPFGWTNGTKGKRGGGGRV